MSAAFIASLGQFLPARTPCRFSTSLPLSLRPPTPKYSLHLTTCTLSYRQPKAPAIPNRLISTTLTLVLSAFLIILNPVQPPLITHASAIPRLPPIDRNNPDRCEPVSSAIGQANAARDQLLDLRECDLRNRDLSRYDISGALLEKADLSDSKLVDSQMSKAYAPDAKFKNVDFTNGIIDRVQFDGSDLQGAIFANAVLSDTSFENANVEDTDWTRSFLGNFDQKKLCKNPTLRGENPVTGVETRASLGCE